MNRRIILRSLLASPFVIRTPGLLMPVRALDPVLNFKVWRSTFSGMTWNMDPDDTSARLIELLSQQHEMLSDIDDWFRPVEIASS